MQKYCRFVSKYIYAIQPVRLWQCAPKYAQAHHSPNDVHAVYLQLISSNESLVDRLEALHVVLQLLHHADSDATTHRHVQVLQPTTTDLFLVYCCFENGVWANYVPSIF